MKKRFTQIMILAVLLACFGWTALAGSAWNEADTTAPFAIRYMDADNVGTITVTSNTVVLVDDGNTNTITHATAYNTLTEYMAGVNAATNTSGTKNFEAVYWCGLAADAIATNSLVALSATTLTRQWSYAVKWDTSTCLHYDSAVGAMIQTTPVAAGKIDRIFGDPIGTGDVTLSIYVDGSKKWSRLIASPVYVTPSSTSTGGWVVPTVTNTFITVGGGTNAAVTQITNSIVSAGYTVTATTNANTADNGVAFDLAVDIPVGTQPAFVRAARATSATTGGIGISDTRR